MWRYDPKAAREIGEAWQAANSVIAASGAAATILLDNPLQRAARDLPLFACIRRGISASRVKAMVRLPSDQSEHLLL